MGLWSGRQIDSCTTVLVRGHPLPWQVPPWLLRVLCAHLTSPPAVCPALFSLPSPRSAPLDVPQTPPDFQHCLKRWAPASALTGFVARMPRPSRPPRPLMCIRCGFWSPQCTLTPPLPSACVLLAVMMLSTPSSVSRLVGGKRCVAGECLELPFLAPESGRCLTTYIWAPSFVLMLFSRVMGVSLLVSHVVVVSVSFLEPSIV